MPAAVRVGTPQQVAIMAAAAVTPGTFARSLTRRSWQDQALITGLSAGSTYLLTLVAQDIMELLGTSLGDALPLPAGTSTQSRHHVGTVAVNLAAVPAGIAVGALLPVDDEESTVRSLARQTGWRLGMTGLVAALLTGADSGLAGLDARVGADGRIDRIPPAVPLGLALSVLVEQRRRKQDPEPEDTGLPSDNPLLGLAGAAGVVGVLGGLAVGESALAGGLGRLGSRFLPGSEGVWRLGAHAASLTGLGFGVHALWGMAMRKIEAGATTFEDVLPETARDIYVPVEASGSRQSLVSWSALGREGRRHVTLYARPEPLPPEQRPEGTPPVDLSIPAVMGEPATATPISVYVGLDAAPSARERVELALAEMDRTGAWTRSLIMLCSPTGSGYVNYVASAAVQYYTLGDCATVTLQYSKRPSPLSLGLVARAREQNRLLWLQILKRLRDVDPADRPKVVLFGESLGAHTSQDAFLHWGTLGPQALGLDRALWIGTPYGSEWSHEVTGRSRTDADPDLVAVVNDFGEIEAMDPERRAALRYVLLSHDNDGVTKFGTDLLARRPRWLGPTRQPVTPVPPYSPRGIPSSMRWRPVTTFFQLLVDMKNAQIPGSYSATGHDYRPDLPAFIREVFDLKVTDEQMAAVAAAVEQRESFRESLFD